MLIRMFMVTYKGHKRLYPTLNSIFNSNPVDDVSVSVNIINNHTDIRVPECYQDQVNVIHNSLRPDFSCGHLSRNWNQALVNGFESLSNPACDIVVCTQDDSIFHPDWLTRLIELHKVYSFVHGGHGDQFHSYTPEAVKRVGLWDERFCGLTRQAADYFYRQYLYNKEGCTINDPGHRREWNLLLPNPVDASSYLVDPDVRQIDANMGHIPEDEVISRKLLQEKWGYDPYPWDAQLLAATPSAPRHYITYPYFEKDVYDLQGKGYLV